MKKIILLLIIISAAAASAQIQRAPGVVVNEIDDILVEDDDDIFVNDTIRGLSSDVTDVKEKSVIVNDTVAGLSSDVTEKTVIENDTVAELSSDVTEKTVIENDTVSESSSDVTEKTVIVNDTVAELSSGVTEKTVTVNDTVAKLSSDVTEKSVIVNDTVAELSSDVKEESLVVNDTVAGVSSDIIEKIVEDTAALPPKSTVKPPPKKPALTQALAALSSAYAFPAGYASYSSREGYRKFKGVDGYEPVPRPGMFMFGFGAGVRFPFKKIPGLRIQSQIEAGWGGSEEEFYPEAALSGWVYPDVYEYLKLWTAGAQTDLQMVLPTPDRNAALVLSAGPGVHVTTFYNSWESRRRELMKTGDMRTVALSLNAGCGIEYRINRRRAIAVNYNLRIWEPVYYNDYGDAFPMGAKYTEVFLSHTVQAQILLPRKSKAFF